MNGFKLSRGLIFSFGNFFAKEDQVCLPYGSGVFFLSYSSSMDLCLNFGSQSYGPSSILEFSKDF
jgi:hypothetical protein